MKKIASIIIIVMILILTDTISQAKTEVGTTLSSDSEKLYAENTVLVTVKLDKFQEITHSINAYQATLL